MTDKVFGKVYADQYDLLYSDKDYEAECDLIETFFGNMETGKLSPSSTWAAERAITPYSWPGEDTR
jgi:hypothetical protein